MSTGLLKRELSLRPARRPKAKPTSKPKTKTKTPGTHRRVVGLKIGASQLSAAVVTNNGAPTLTQVAREPLADGIVVGGELREPLALAEALKAFFGKHKLPTRGVRLGIANNRIGVRTFELPDVDPKQLENAIRFRAQDALPIPVEEAVLDYHVLDERFGESTPRVLLVVMYRELVDGFAGACRTAGLTLAGIDLEAFGLLRALNAPGDASAPARDAALVAVAIGHERSTVAVTNGRSCELTRVVDWGGANLDRAIARALNIPADEAPALKHGLSLGSAQESTEDARADRAREVVVRELHGFARQLVSSLHFYQTQPGALEIGEVVVTGGTSQLPGLANELGRLVGAPVRVGDPLGRVTLGKKVEINDHLGSLAVAIGLGIED
jgi:type IV pilus assembly protein PilM